jgi:hypothetical protein
VVGATTVDDGGRLAPGNSPGILTVTNGALSLAPAAQLDFEIGAITNARSYYDAVKVYGDLNLDGVLNVTSWSNGFGATSGTNVYALFDYTGTLTDTGVELGAVPTNLAYKVDTATTGQVSLAVKEFARGSFSGTGLTTTLVLNFGTNTQSASSNALTFQLFNFDPTDLALGLELTNVTGVGGPFGLDAGLFSGLTGASNLTFTSFMDLGTVGSFSNVVTFNLTSALGGFLVSGDPFHQLTLVLTGDVVAIPEPGSMIVLLACGGLAATRRRPRRG